MKKNIRHLPALLALLLLCSLSGCGSRETSAPTATSAPTQNTPAAPGEGSTQVVTLTLMDDHIAVNGDGVTVDGASATITKGGEYLLCGTLREGQILVDTGESAEKVTLRLENAHISHSQDAAIHIRQADKVKLVLVEGSHNSVTSGSEGMAVVENANGAAIFSEDDLDIEGEGELEIYGYINNGITCKDDLVVQGGQLTVIAANNGLRGSESVQIEAGSVTVTSVNDAIKATSTKKEGKGFISVSGGDVTVNARGDGFSAATQLLVSGGTLHVVTTGDPEQGSCKGLKADQGIRLQGGSFTLDTTDHAIRSGGDLEISGGSYSISASMGRGLSAKGEIRIEGEPSFDINAIEDGILSDTDIAISGGSFRIASGEDGIHAGSSTSGEGTLTIRGGSLLVSAYQDALDAKSHLYIHGGNVLAVGRSKQLKAASAGSSQPSFACLLSAPSRSELAVTSADGAELGRMTSSYSFTQLLFSSPLLEKGGSYSATADGATVDATA